MAGFTCFLDETVAHSAPEPITGVAGFLFRDEVLDALRAEWSLQTGHLGGPFHARKHKRHDWLLVDLAKIIAKYRGIGIVCTVVNRDFAEWARTAPTARAWLGNPYCLALSYAIGMVRSRIKRDGLEGDVSYVIEDGAQGKIDGERFLTRVMAQHREAFRLRGFRFLPKSDPDAVLLATADHLAWVWQRNYTEATSEDLDRERAKPGREPESDELGWTAHFRGYYTPDSEPLLHQNFARGSFSGLALQLALEGLHRD